MANHQSAKKRIRQNDKRRIHNRVTRGGARSAVKAVRAAIEAGDLETAELMVRKASSALDKAARKGVVHPRNAARRKGRLMAAVAAAQKAAA